MKTRITAFLIHIALSIIAAAITLLIIFFIWYPSPLHQAHGVTTIFFILLAVDVCLGPILTFIIYNPKKKYLMIDLTIIALLQISALAYGVNTIFQGRPAFIVFSKDRFETISTADIDADSMKTALANNNKLADASWLGPKWIAAIPSKNEDRRQEIIMSSAFGGADWPQLPELYTPLTEVKPQIIEKSKPLNEIRKLHHKAPDVNKKLQGENDKDVRWLPLLSKANNMIVLIDAHNAQVLKIVDIDPWP